MHVLDEMFVKQYLIKFNTLRNVNMLITLACTKIIKSQTRS